ncbi:type VI secretion system-associated lipoprotein TagQ [Pseudomonas chlororaphis]|uniref:type VI secretion system-associated lipoprotein TagQ n=1 Tax=Pseudomonas chlororaphis TaxID=587753 RepID=UPI0006A63545|nr:type VI secretion system-associated lipoprotein TagQ [Pseudomonas chlororaphis]AZD02934.1 Autotransporter adhesin [Pseudomonas chlororaphis subsp. chlororaphis]MBM0282922.1 type VI secretion-associated lipoprotein TagQ [Pseudomonas chlororaphis]MDO1508532.1 type VI secretion-associated lipoprotein TagQ [Pseudomonas chlororaphis]ORM45666.1 type VI secretion-associated lipoprotein TagQ [Pseudomonas chlororaphis subsp. chlororaphis]TWR91898.1 type VI secretion-associated lipoprotein TagQ [Pseu
MDTSLKNCASTLARTLPLPTAVCCAVLLGGCAGFGAPSSKVAAQTKVEYYPQCYEPVSQLRSSDKSMTKSVATGAIAGGLLGGLTGALVGNSGDAGRNALIGAAAGALVGGATGYYSERQKQISDDRARIASYASDIGQSTGEIDRSISYTRTAQNCYQREFTSLLNARKAKKISDSEGRLRLAEIVSGLKETNALMAAADGRAGESIDVYTQAYEKDLQTVGVQRQDVAQVAAVKPPAATDKKAASKKTSTKTATKTNVPKEAVTTERTLQQATAKREEGQKIAARGQTMVNDVCSNPDMGDWAPPACSKA